MCNKGHPHGYRIKGFSYEDSYVGFEECKQGSFTIFYKAKGDVFGENRTEGLRTKNVKKPGVEFNENNCVVMTSPK